MSTAADEIQTHYLDALGRRREPPPEAVAAIRRAIGEPHRRPRRRSSS